MFQKINLVLTIILCLSITPQKVKADDSIGEIIKGISLAKDIVELAAPLLISCGKTIKKVCLKIAKSLKKNRYYRNNKKTNQELNDELYVNPLRVAATIKHEVIDVQYVFIGTHKRYLDYNDNEKERFLF